MKISYKSELDLTRPVYQCRTCGKVFNWNEESVWYGSDKQMEEHPENIPYFCSHNCFLKYPIKKQVHKRKKEMR